MKDKISLNELVNSGLLGHYSYYQVRKFVLIGVGGKKLPAKIATSPFGGQGQRVDIKLSDVEEFRKHLSENRAQAVKTIA